MSSTQSLVLTELLPSNPELQLSIVIGGLLAFVHDGSHIKFQVLYKSLAT